MLINIFDIEFYVFRDKFSELGTVRPFIYLNVPVRRHLITIDY